MFKYVPGAVSFAWWPVKWASPKEDGGVIENRIELRFRLLDDDAFNDLMLEQVPALDKKLIGLAGEELEAQRRANRATFVRAMADGWRGIGDSEDKPLDFTDDLIASVFALPGLTAAATTAFRQCRVGERPND